MPFYPRGIHSIVRTGEHRGSPVIQHENRFLHSKCSRQSYPRGEEAKGSSDDCPWDERTCSQAALWEHLGVTQWAYSN